MKEKGEWRQRSSGQESHNNEAVVAGRRLNVQKLGGDKCRSELHRIGEKRRNKLRIERNALLE